MYEIGKTMYAQYVKLRDRAGLTDGSVAANTGMTSAALANWKAGKYTPKIDKIAALAKFFEVPIEYFLEE